MAESEMVATGLLKFDIFEETDRKLDDGLVGTPLVENNPIMKSEITKQIKLFGVVADETKENLKSSSQESG